MPETSEIESVRAARDAFLARYGFDLDSYTAPRFTLHFGCIEVRVRNPGVLRRVSRTAQGEQDRAGANSGV